VPHELAAADDKCEAERAGRRQRLGKGGGDERAGGQRRAGKTAKDRLEGKTF
jgi:hypothetical protein